MIRRGLQALALALALATPACSLDTDALIDLWDGGPPDAPRDAGTAPDGG